MISIESAKSACGGCDSATSATSAEVQKAAEIRHPGSTRKLRRLIPETRRNPCAEVAEVKPPLQGEFLERISPLTGEGFWLATDRQSHPWNNPEHDGTRMRVPTHPLALIDEGQSHVTWKD